MLSESQLVGLKTKDRRTLGKINWLGKRNRVSPNWAKKKLIVGKIFCEVKKDFGRLCSAMLP